MTDANPSPALEAGQRAHAAYCEAIGIMPCWDSPSHIVHRAAWAAVEAALAPAPAAEEKGACPVCGCEEVDHRDLWTCRCPAPAPGFKAVDPGQPYYAPAPAAPVAEDIAGVAIRNCHADDPDPNCALEAQFVERIADLEIALQEAVDAFDTISELAACPPTRIEAKRQAARFRAALAGGKA